MQRVEYISIYNICVVFWRQGKLEITYLFLSFFVPSVFLCFFSFLFVSVSLHPFVLYLFKLFILPLSEMNLQTITRGFDIIGKIPKSHSKNLPLTDIYTRYNSLLLA